MLTDSGRRLIEGVIKQGVLNSKHPAVGRGRNPRAAYARNRRSAPVGCQLPPAPIDDADDTAVRQHGDVAARHRPTLGQREDPVAPMPRRRCREQHQHRDHGANPQGDGTGHDTSIRPRPGSKRSEHYRANVAKHVTYGFGRRADSQLAWTKRCSHGPFHSRSATPPREHDTTPHQTVAVARGSSLVWPRPSPKWALRSSCG
jgi:hypothetical protein